MNVVLRIKRYNPETDSSPHFEDFKVDVQPTDRLLDALMFVKRHLDGSLSFRKSCAHGICGSDAMTINGSERLACKTLVRDVADEEDAVITIEPLQALPVQRDLMVDYTRFFEFYRVVKPYLFPAQHVDKGEHLQTLEERKKFDDVTKCILCASCQSACPVIREGTDFIGPAAIVQAARFVFDSRDRGIGARLDVLDAANGVWPCENHLECTRVCPRGIKVTKAINLTKREIKTFKEGGHQNV
ncbi:MAG: succinate dehydrogenase iron-sulfur subunit [Sedimentisphaerales bacterium]|nr:succinate dehydrogenase iron-sulfur subunit [Sedimentisphaerales bacterium]